MYKKLFFVLLLSGLVTGAMAQNPVQWKFSARKIADKTYEVRLNATVKQPWHIYSGTTPDGGPLPTKITFSANPLLVIDGKISEEGKIIKKYEDVFDVNVLYFDGPATFIQVVKLKKNAKTNLSGTIEFMACNDEQCMPPAKVSFTVLLN